MDKIKKMDNIFNYKSFNCLNEYIAYNTRDNFDKYLKFYYGYNIDYINPIFNTTNGCWLESILLLLFESIILFLHVVFMSSLSSVSIIVIITHKKIPLNKFYI